MNTDTQYTAADHDLGVETLRTVIVGSLGQLAGMLDLTSEMVHGHQRGLGFLTADGRVMLDDLMRRERRDRLEHAKQLIQVSGASPAPGNIKAWATNAEVHVALAGVHHKVMRRLSDAGVCLTWRTPADPAPLVLMARIGVLVMHVTNVDLLNEVDRTLQQLIEIATRLVDGQDKKPHHDPCPHCDRKTLVVYLEEGVIRCEKDPATGEYESCICPDSYCPCKVKRHRHEWHRDKGTAVNSWWHLSDELSRIRRARQESS